MESQKPVFCRNKIDIHAHTTVCDWPKAPWNTRLSPEELIEKYREMGVEKGLLLPLITAEANMILDTPETLFATVQKYPESFLWAMNLDPRMGQNNCHTNFGEMIEFYKSMGAKSVGELTANLRIDDKRYDNLFAQCAEHDMPITIHLSQAVGFYYGMVDDLGLPQLEAVLKKYPKLKVFGHSQMFWAHLSADVGESDFNGYPTGKVIPGRIEELLEKYDNLYCDLSANSGYNALARDEEYAARFIGKFSDRIMFGLDICSLQDNRPLPALLDSMLEKGVVSQKDYDLICRGNAVRLLKLEE